MAAAVEKAYRAIRDGIIAGAYRPGDHLTAQKLALASGLSRNPVREAMRRLQVEGLIAFIPHRGAFVARLDERDIHKIYDLRVALEGYAAEAAAREATREQIDDLSRLAEQMDTVLRGGAATLAKDLTSLNNRFHRLIAAAAANPQLETALDCIVETPLVLRTFRGCDMVELRRGNSQHHELVLAIAARDAVWARSVMTSHIQSGRNALLRNWAQDRD
jgi:DNA-binding GntR family transcriptional regulator